MHGTDNLKGKRVLVTGASGFIGRYLTQELLRLGACIGVIIRGSVPLLPATHVYYGDINDKGFVGECVAGFRPEFIFHLAARKQRLFSVESFYDAIQDNIVGTLNLLVAAGKLDKLQKLVIAGTVEEYGNNKAPFEEGTRELPVSSYSYSKMCVTHLSEVFHTLYDLPVVVVRPTLAYGPGQGREMFLPALICDLTADKSFSMTRGEQTRDYIFISDLTDAFIRAAIAGRAGQTYNVGSGSVIRIADLAMKVGKYLGKAELIRMDKDYRPGEVMDYFVDTGKISRELDWRPTVGLEEGLKRTIDHYLGAGQ